MYDVSRGNICYGCAPCHAHWRTSAISLIKPYSGSIGGSSTSSPMRTRFGSPTVMASKLPAPSIRSRARKERICAGWRSETRLGASFVTLRRGRLTEVFTSGIGIGLALQPAFPLRILLCMTLRPSATLCATLCAALLKASLFVSLSKHPRTLNRFPKSTLQRPKRGVKYVILSRRPFSSIDLPFPHI